MKTLTILLCATAALLTLPSCVSVDREAGTSPTSSTSTRSSTAVSTSTNPAMPYEQRTTRSTTVQY